jgi:hypothetical protein
LRAIVVVARAQTWQVSQSVLTRSIVAR